jgi:ABC-type branched-subunit amino acid transport system permease subunit
MSTHNLLQFAVLGLGTGAMYCLIVQGLVTIYAGSGILNLAQAAQAMFGAYLFRDLHHLRGWSFFPAAATTIIFCALSVRSSGDRTRSSSRPTFRRRSTGSAGSSSRKTGSGCCSSASC